MKNKKLPGTKKESLCFQPVPLSFIMIDLNPGWGPEKKRAAVKRKTEKRNRGTISNNDDTSAPTQDMLPLSSFDILEIYYRFDRNQNRKKI